MRKPFSLIEALESLKRTRKLFSSEADFQFALAWTIKELFPHVDVRLEWIPVDYNPNIYIDIVVFENGNLIPIELKYKTKKTDKVVDGERLVLKNQSATDLGRYDFLKDIQRIEFIKQHFTSFKEGYAVLLTNDPSYLATPSTNASYSAFSIATGDIKTGALRWAASSKAIKGREGIDLIGSYPMQWSEYSRIDDTESVQQLVVPIRR